MSRIEEARKSYPINKPLLGIEGFCHVMAKIFCKENIDGVQNLEKIRELSNSGHPIIMVGNHRSNADAAALYAGLVKAGFEDLAKKIKYILGQRLKFDWKTRYLTRGYSHIDVFPPTVSTDEREMRRMKAEMNSAAMKNAKDVLSNNGILGLFPEGGRTKDGVMHDFLPETMAFALLCEDTYIAPFSLVGTDNVWPVGSSVWHRKDVGLNFAAPFSVDEVVVGAGSGSEKRLLLARRAQIEVVKLSPVEYIPKEMEMRMGQEYAIVRK